MATFQELSEAIQKGQAPKAREITQSLLGEKKPPGEILNKGLLDGMDKIGQRFKVNEVYIPEVLIAARAMHGGLGVLEPQLKATGVKPVGIVVLGTVKGDLHDIGKNLVGMMLTGAGLKVVDVGTDAPPEKFIQAAKDNAAQVLALSALLTTTMPQRSEVIKAVKTANLKVKTMIGGAPVTQAYADEIGADGYAPDAASAADKALELIKA